MWSKRYDRELTDVFEIQDEISNAIAIELKVSLTSRPLVKPPTTHFAAYEAVLQGRHHFFRFDPQGQAQAFAAFEKAVTIDPGYADAHVGLALYHWGQMVIGMAHPRQAMARSVESARQAMRLDPASSPAHHILDPTSRLTTSTGPKPTATSGARSSSTRARSMPTTVT